MGLTQISASCVRGIISSYVGPSTLIQVSTVFVQLSFAFVHIIFEGVRFCRNAGKEHLYESHCIVSL